MWRLWCILRCNYRKTTRGTLTKTIKEHVYAYSKKLPRLRKEDVSLFQTARCGLIGEWAPPARRGRLQAPVGSVLAVEGLGFITDTSDKSSPILPPRHEGLGFRL